jgi:transcriptional regulator with XRE-family HTH domain
MTDVGKIFGKNLERIRESKGLTKESLARTLGVSRQSIYSYENGERLVNSEIISKLAKSLGVDELDFFLNEKPVEMVELQKDQWQDIKRTLEKLRPISFDRNVLPQRISDKLLSLNEETREHLLSIFELQLNAALGLGKKDKASTG